jgi:DNA-binding transcriptional regulator YiaG
MMYHEPRNLPTPPLVIKPVQTALRMIKATTPVARLLNVSPRTVQRWRVGRHRPHPLNRAKLMTLYKIALTVER